MNRCREILARHTWNIEVSCLLLLVMVVDSASTLSCRGDSLSLVSVSDFVGVLYSVLVCKDMNLHNCVTRVLETISVFVSDIQMGSRMHPCMT